MINDLSMIKKIYNDIERLDYSHLVFTDLYKSINPLEAKYYIVSLYVLSYFLDTNRFLKEFQLISTETMHSSNSSFVDIFIKVLINLIKIRDKRNVYSPYSSLLCLKLHEYLTIPNFRPRFLEEISIFSPDVKSSEYKELLLLIENYDHGMLL